MAMSDHSLPESFATEFLEVLNSLRCPYTHDVDESYISELLLSPGEHRIGLLLWIFGEVDESVEKMVNSEDVTTRQASLLGVDKRVQILTSLGASFGICRVSDFDLIRGKAPFARQFSFWKKLLKTVRHCKQPYLDDALREDFVIMDQIITQEQSLFQRLAQDKVQLLPHNLEKEISMMLPKQKRMLGTFGSTKEELKKLSEDLEIQQNRLKEMEENMTYTDQDDSVTVRNICCKLDLTLNDIDQMMTVYEQVFANSFLPYCNKQMEEFGNLGPTIQIVEKQLSYVVNSFDRLIGIKTSSDSITKSASSWPQMKEKTLRLKSMFDNFLSESVPCLEKLEKTLSTHRQDDGCTGCSDTQFSDRSEFGSKLAETLADISSVGM